MLSNFLAINTTDITAIQFILCTASSLTLGLAIAFMHMYRNTYSKHFILTLVIMPAIIQAVILLVNGNIGTGVAVMGAFSLVRFRSVPGNSREIASIFLAMAVGLATGTGYIGTALLLTIVVGAVVLLLISLNFGTNKTNDMELKITIPENLEFGGIFDDLLNHYTEEYKLLRVKTTNMGSLFELEYQFKPKADIRLKAMIDDIRCRNGNLTVLCRCQPTNKEEL